MFDFLGHLTKTEFDNFRTAMTPYVDSTEIEKRITHITAEITRLQELKAQLSTSELLGSIRPTPTENDVTETVRPMLKQRTDTTASDNDYEVASAVRAMKTPFIRVIRRQGERLEYRIKRIIDEIRILTNEKTYLQSWLDENVWDKSAAAVNGFIQDDVNYPEAKNE